MIDRAETGEAAMHWHVLGAGSIGGLWAGRLALAGYPVTLLLRDREALSRFQRSPLILEDAGGISKPPVGAIPAGLLSARIEWLLVTTKSFATLDAIGMLGKEFLAGSNILLLQNGVGFQQQVAETCPEATVMAGVTTDGAYRRGPFHVVHAGSGVTRFGAVSRVPDTTARRLRQCFAGLAAPVDWVDDIWPHLWHKLAINCCINALSALRKCPNGALLESEESRREMRALAAEVQAVTEAAGLACSFPGLYDDVESVIRATADNYSSMHQDLARGRGTEIEHINGFICAEGDRLGVATPANRALLEAIRAASPKAVAR